MAVGAGGGYSECRAALTRLVLSSG